MGGGGGSMKIIVFVNLENARSVSKVTFDLFVQRSACTGGCKALQEKKYGLIC